MSKKNINELAHRIALTMVPGIGPVKAKILLSNCGSAEAIFKEKKNSLLRIPDIGEYAANAILSAEVSRRAIEEAEFVERNHIQTLFFTEENYPDRLRTCDDSPILLYVRGELNLNCHKVISIVGTRKATPYGKQFCEEFLRSIKSHKPLIVSGLAYGIDICAHRNAIKENLPTVACLAHGMDKIYPPLHIPVAKEMMQNGGLITEFMSGTKPDRELFPTRNRIIAGLADCTIVVESDVKGGSVITAQVANSYNRDVFAVPGRCNDRFSAGCNELIKRNVAAILNNAEELVSYMNWDEPSIKKNKQLDLFVNLNDDERSVMNALVSAGKLSIDEINEKTGFNGSKTSSLLLQLEFRGQVKAYPGKMYSCANQ